MSFFKPAVAATAIAFAGAALAEGTARYEVVITNITKGQTFTPQLVVGHNASARLFTLGDPASEALAILAEAGDTGPLSGILMASDGVTDVTTIGDLLPPGASARTEIVAPRVRGLLSFAAMMIPSNDNFVALNGVRLPLIRDAAYHALAYDAGSEANDQDCAHIPGPPPCFGEGFSEPADTDEGFVHVGSGFHELGSMDGDGVAELILGAAEYDWRNPVAHVTVRRLR